MVMVNGTYPFHRSYSFTIFVFYFQLVDKKMNVNKFLFSVAPFLVSIFCPCLFGYVTLETNLSFIPSFFHSNHIFLSFFLYQSDITCVCPCVYDKKNVYLDFRIFFSISLYSCKSRFLLFSG